ncbi:unnamed protein product [Rotaria sp. Silwood2]|nr:unnamed protein product [Rotaria sp. Silwood2]CAF2643013.1 unnamed protein product [Rotaria sp. Silwood2]CAF2920449.1 unnamed protein product [Rotaria sp. Silwood2]CAF3151395.1 unnamed protein product [Rotaria sp. Silwood2]CAF4226194.1 unnamed protein product [Rotaria sp. Silwood2]
MQLSKTKKLNDNEVHKHAQQLELQNASSCQPSWATTQMKERSKHEILIKALSVKLLPAELGSVTYRNDKAALQFLRHVLLIYTKKFLKNCLGWMIDESTSRNVKNSLIIYARYFGNGESKTNFYGVLGLDGSDSIVNIANGIKLLWRKDDLNPEKTCWLAADNAAIFTGIKPLF